MDKLHSEEILIGLCSLIILSYVFSILSRYIRVPSVLLLLFAGIGFRVLADNYQIKIDVPGPLVESLGVVGLIMIVLEAGLDLKMEKSKIKLIQDSFFSALVIFIISATLLVIILHYWMHEPIKKCLAYAIPLSIMSSTIVIPSIHPLSDQKREFLIYEASFSDIMGILAFNFIIANQTITWLGVGSFAISIILSIIASVLLSFLLFLILAKTKLNIKFFLIFSLLILIYEGGKMLNLPSLIIILLFGLLMNNWEKIQWPRLLRYLPNIEMGGLRHLLHSVTAETSFLIRTFFFLFFGFTISLDFFTHREVLIVGSLIVVALFVTRILYLRFFVKTNLFPESFFIPRGLITIVLFYKIPSDLKLTSFNDGILFFVILVTSFIMALGMIFYKKKPEQVLEEGTFAERADIL